MKTKKFQIVDNKKFITGKGICLGLGSKVDVDDIKFSSGGGGTNTAATFSKQGLKTAYCGMVGQDLGGEKVIEELDKLGISTRFISRTRLKPTNTSVVLNPEKKDRTILVYRGASELLSKRDIVFSKLKAEWFYIAPLSGLLCEVTDDIINYAYKNKIKIVLNPGHSQLSLPFEEIKKMLKKVDILILNQEEASLLTGIDYKKEKEIFKKIDRICPGTAIMTKGAKGVIVSDGRHLYKAKPAKIKVVDGTGAGDSFGSGFVSGFIKSKGDIEFAVQLGIANANSCLLGWGAKSKLLEDGQKFEKIEVEKELCSKNELCAIKN